MVINDGYQPGFESRVKYKQIDLLAIFDLFNKLSTFFTYPVFGGGSDHEHNIRVYRVLDNLFYRGSKWADLLDRR